MSSAPTDPGQAPRICSIRRLADVLACAQQATELALGIGFSKRASWEVSIAVSELATNITRHADTGTITLRAVTEPDAGIEIVARDDGPGIPDVGSALTDDFSEGRLLAANVLPSHRRGLGSGLGAVRRLTDDLDITSDPHRGTTIRAFKRLPALQTQPLTGVPEKQAAVEAPKETTAATSAPELADEALGPEAVLMLGLGNTILTDDGIGIRVVRHLAETPLPTGLVIKEAEVAGFALLDLLEGFDRAVIVDAVRIRDSHPGEVVVFESGRLDPSLHLVAGHQIDLPTALEMGRALGIRVPEVVHVVGVQIEDDQTFSETCTPRVAAALAEAARVALDVAATGRSG